MQAKGSSKKFPMWLAVTLMALVIGCIAFEFAKDKTSGGAPVVAPVSGDGLVTWMVYETALDESRKTGKPILYDFSAEWCGPCKRLEHEIFDDPKWSAMINDNFIPVQVMDRRREEGSNPPWIEDLQRRYSVSGFPTLVIDTSDGSEPSITAGYGGPAHIEQFLNSRIKDN
jgi:thiol:disulfide interchange protein